MKSLQKLYKYGNLTIITMPSFLQYCYAFFVILTSLQGASVFAETVSGGGYIIEQVIAPVQGTLSGNGYVVQQSSQQQGGIVTGGGYMVNSVFGTGAATSSIPQAPPQSSGGGYYVFPPYFGTTTVVNGGSTTQQSTSTLATLNTASTCKTRITFTGPIDVGATTNLKEDVEKLEGFLNTYENEKLSINGVYEKKDIEAVKRWQSKYQSFILTPMNLKKPTGTVYTLSQRQIERQTTKSCGQPIVVTACPFFRDYLSYGDRGEGVKKIQQFLNITQGEKLPVSGVYGPLTREATKRFQRAYKKDIFNILKLSFISGNWNEATRVKANQAIGCDILK